MRAAVYEGIRNIVLKDIPDPVAGPDDIVVRVVACGICGSDVHTYGAGWYGSPGQVMGHEFSGEVEQVGATVKGLSVGDRVCALAVVPCGECVACRQGGSNCQKLMDLAIGYGTPGAFAEKVKIPKARLDSTVFRLPAELSFEQGALVEPLSVAFHAVSLGDPGLGDNVLVLGCGLVGLLVIRLLRARGCGAIVGVEVKKARREAALVSGADMVIDPTQEDLNSALDKMFGKGVRPTVVFECAGVPTSFSGALDLVALGGTVVMVAMHEQPSTLIPSLIVERGLKILGSLGYSLGPDSRAVISLLKRKRIDLSNLVSHRFSLEKAPQAFQASLFDEGAVKILVTS